MKKRYEIRKLDGYFMEHGENVDLFVYIKQHHDIQDLAILALIFCPDFTEKDGFIYLSELYSPETVDQWYEKLNNYSEVQRIVNHIHLDDFLTYSESADDEIYSTFLNLCVKIKACWTGILLVKFPALKFQVTLEYDSDGYDPVITFFQV